MDGREYMCLAIPAKVLQLLDNQKAIVSVGGVKKTISVALLDSVSIDDYVILHVGYALTKLNKDDAEKTLHLFSQMLQGET